MINLRDLPSNKYVHATSGLFQDGTATYQPLTLYANRSSASLVTTTDLYDFSNMSTITWAWQRLSGNDNPSGNSAIKLVDENGTIIAYKDFSGSTSGTWDVSSYNGNYKVNVTLYFDNTTSTGATIKFNTLSVQ